VVFRRCANVFPTPREPAKRGPVIPDKQIPCSNNYNGGGHGCRWIGWIPGLLLARRERLIHATTYIQGFAGLGRQLLCLWGALVSGSQLSWVCKDGFVREENIGA